LTVGLARGVLGFTPQAEASGRTRWTYVVDPAHFNPNGTLHGGVVMALLDTAMGYAVAALVGPDDSLNVAAEMNVHFLEPVRAGTLAATATVRKRGKRLAVVEAEATDGDGRVVAIATAVHSILARSAVTQKAASGSAPDRS
jgi:uncharacterized protein (TIGR00369 family)